MSILPPPSSTRLVTIVAQVDHGKTTLADSLIEHNGIISERLAGSMRFLDSLEEEQRRGITMKSSSIALKHTYRPMKIKANQKKRTLATNSGNINSNTNTSANSNNNKEMVIHLIDSPGHVDFSMEVSSALQICDGALLIVDVVEGMCARAQSILRESYSQKLVPILVLNKVDRLCTDLGLDVNEAYLRIRSLIESVNAAASAMIRSDRAKDMASNTDTSTNDVKHKNQEIDNEEDDEVVNIWTFEPSKGNVVFTSAIYGWGFTIPSLARSLFKSKTIQNIKPPIIRQYLFGDYKYNPYSGKVLKWKQQAADDENVTMFAEYGLRPLWQCFTGVSTAATSLGMTSIFFTGNSYQMEYSKSEDKSKKDQKDIKIKATTPGMCDLIFSSLQSGITCPDDAQQSLQPPKTLDEMQQVLNKTNASSEELVLRALLRRHRPLSDAVLDAVCDICPSPNDASSHIRKDALSLMKNDSNSCHDENDFNFIQNAVRNCDTSAESPVVAHCSKFISTSRSHVKDSELISHLESISGEESEDPSNVVDTTTQKDPVIILGVGRVLSGILRSKDVAYYCFGPKYNPGRDMEKLCKKTIRLYILMGSSYVRVQSVPAGHFCAIYGLEELQLKTVTLCSSPNAMPLAVIDRGVRPLVKVNVEAKSPSGTLVSIKTTFSFSYGQHLYLFPTFFLTFYLDTWSTLDTAILEKGLAKLSLADPAVEVIATAKGERILACLGEIHLEQSILDLQKLYCGKNIDLRISEQIVEFGESTTWFENELSDFGQFYNLQSSPLRQTLIPPYCYEDGLGHARNGRSRAVVSNKGAAIHVRVIPLPERVHESLVQKSKVESCEEDLILIAQALGLESDDTDEILKQLMSLLISFDKRGNAMIQSSYMTIKGVISSTNEVFVPPSLIKPSDDGNEEKQDTNSQNHGNDETESPNQQAYSEIREFICSRKIQEEYSDADEFVQEIWSGIQGSCTAGFQAGCATGPLCEEPVRRVLVILEGVEIAIRRNRKTAPVPYRIAKAVSGGMIVASLKTAIRTSLLTRPARLVEGYLCLTLHSSLTGLGPLYAILSRRRGRVISDTMVDGTDLISIDARLPQSESFGLAPELLQKSSGEVTAPELIFSHWEILDEDPFWIPTSLEEREDYGEIVLNGDCSTGLDNNALKYIRMVRDRKGLIVDSNKIIVAAEKQRTLARKK